MEEKDFQRIAQMVTQIIDTKFEQQSVRLDSKLDQLSDQFDAKLGKFDAKLDLWVDDFDSKLKRLDAKLDTTAADFDSKLKRLDAKLDTTAADFGAKLDRHKEELLKEFRHQISLQTDDFNKGLAFIAEGHQMLDEKVDRIELRLDAKIDSQTRELDAHRSDPEAHRGIFRTAE